MTYVLYFYLAGVATMLFIFMNKKGVEFTKQIAEKNGYGPFHMTVLTLISAALWPILLPLAMSHRK